MLKRLSPRERFEQLVSTYEPMLRTAFIEAIDDIRSNIVLRRVVERLERGDINGAIRAMNLDEAAFRPLEEAIRQTFNGGGVATVEQMPALRDPSGFQVVLRWDARNLVAETWLREHSAQLVTDIVADQQVAIRTALETSLARGDNPTRTAVDVVGRVSRVTGQREGGIIGLTAQQSQYVENARQELSSGDPEAIRNYLQRGRRDKRFDRTVAKALREGKPLPRDMVNRITARYSDGLLKLRADTIGLHETFAALGASKDIAFQQAIAKGAVRADAITKGWKHTPQEHPRVQHVSMQGQKVRFDQPFVAPDGTLIPYPHAAGVPARHTLGCKCFCEYKIDFVAQLVR
ncbi:MAG: Hsp20/alpha crystallin family protein [Mesorhizobium sp.]|uniref:Hsp20/alpha crystallin family protein n=1 Tax=Mesorhizobium sp. TaxID=1871066 RepID=UPI001216D043|nr:Hsp20/alpha crystallin family protein [Mesorhizobium sp.]TIP70579.1 MAG: Hsp20/alpha crystallin family protein [Mesorhizobium sp.]TIQ06769.1 MAG: Hsp20/alpha crystallin family protein [Mesorhizobium sp.]TIR49013.1 MAG: Hsp20/alpha crystallin family protein [Mesorhizobium sp.]TJV94848.1 MAG: Hsp20/alpha crystallin family protein [Mesorhizobium sp.]